jgi:hypothetical protein
MTEMGVRWQDRTRQDRTWQDMVKHGKTKGTGEEDVGDCKVGKGVEGCSKIEAERTKCDRGDVRMERIMREVNNAIQHR